MNRLNPDSDWPQWSETLPSWSALLVGCYLFDVHRSAALILLVKIKVTRFSMEAEKVPSAFASIAVEVSRP